ncbi:MAG TPA: FumA C-terminus/TtdB family hydratase beta subunit, partial [Alphaproteobacteria bacterium]
MFEEINTKTNLPAQIDLYATEGDEYRFLFVAKGGGSANKTFLFQETPAILRPDALLKSLDGKLRSLGTAACPPYHLAVVIGGASAEQNLKAVKLASTRYLDNLPHEGTAYGRAFRDLGLEAQIRELTRGFGIGAQFGGKYFVHDVRVIRLPRHGGSLPIGIGVSCAADRQALGKITADGVFLEALETNPAQYLPEPGDQDIGGEVVRIDLTEPMGKIRKTLSQYPVRTRLSLTGPMAVARDIAHGRLKDRIERGEGLPDAIKNYPIYYAGPAKTPKGYASGSFGPTTSARMDSYADILMRQGGGLVTVGKGNRSKVFIDACKANGGFYLGSVGGPAARLAQDCIRKVEVIDYPELGMEAIYRIEVEDFPAFIITDDKGNDFFQGNAQGIAR